MSAQLGKVEETKSSPMDSLNEGFRQQNGKLEDLIARLRAKLHRLSDTNFPKEAATPEAVAPDLPFRDGHLMYYHDQLIRNENLLSTLNEEVNKLESLI